MTNVRFGDRNFVEAVRRGECTSQVSDMMLCLSVCHSIILEQAGAETVPDPLPVFSSEPTSAQGKEFEGEIDPVALNCPLDPVALSRTPSGAKFNASSPDELAFVNMAKYCGWVFRGTDRYNQVKVSSPSGEMLLPLLHTIEFNSERRRMTVLLDQGETVLVLCKGADSSLLPRLHRANAWAGLTVQKVEEWSRRGLRTLLFGKRVISKQSYEKWARLYAQALTRLGRDVEQQKERNKSEVLRILEDQRSPVQPALSSPRLAPNRPRVLSEEVGAFHLGKSSGRIESPSREGCIGLAWLSERPRGEEFPKASSLVLQNWSQVGSRGRDLLPNTSSLSIASSLINSPEKPDGHEQSELGADLDHFLSLSRVYSPSSRNPSIRRELALEMRQAGGLQDEPLAHI